MTRTRILFVDDEPNVLNGLRRMLRSYRDEWEMEFVESAEEALERLKKSAFDVVVTDMRMRGMDGAELLNRVRQDHPHAVRIVLSGQSDQEVIQQSIARTHQYLSKPCDPQVLRSAVGRACALRDRLNNEGLKKLVSAVNTLPSLPAVYERVLTELRSPDASIQRVAELISQDVAMTAKVLQLINSSFFGLPRRVESPAHAAALLGLNVLRPVVLSAGIFAQFDGRQLGDYSLDAFAGHSLAVSTLARRMAHDVDATRDTVEDSQLAGLVHDVGQLVLASSLTDRYRRALEAARGDDGALREAELNEFGARHCDVGAYLLGLWGLPEPIVEAVAFQDEPSRCPADRFTPLTAVHVANYLISEAGLPGPAVSTAALDEPYVERAGVAGKLPRWRELATEVTAERAVT